MKRRLVPVIPAMHFHFPDVHSIGMRWRFLEPVVRVCQLLLLIALAVFGGRLLAKGFINVCVTLIDLAR
jgi:hypothetical protein